MSPVDIALNYVATNWSSLPEYIKLAVLALVDSATNHSQPVEVSED